MQETFSHKPCVRMPLPLASPDVIFPLAEYYRRLASTKHRTLRRERHMHVNNLRRMIIMRVNDVINRLGGAVVGCQTRDRKVASSTPGRGAIKSTRSTQPSIPLG